MFKFLLILLYENLYNFIYFARSRHSLRDKIRILLLGVKIDIKFIFLVKLFKADIKKENILGFEVSAFNYQTLRALFKDIFCKAQYFVGLENKRPVLFDCGANIGLSVIFFKYIYPESVVFAFEPDKDTFELLSKNVIQNRLEGVNLFNVALSDKEGKIDFFIDNRQKGSLKMSEIFERMPKDKILADAASLPKFIKENNIEHINLVKMDIEGSEKKVIDDLDKNGSFSKISNFIIEYHHKIGSQRSVLSDFLKVFERNNFEYQIDANCIPVSQKNKFQDILIYAYGR